MNECPRLRYFRRLLAAGFLSHAYLWLTMRMLEPGSIVGYPERWSWTPGLFLPTGAHLVVNWLLFLSGVIYLGFGSRPRPAAWALLGLSVIHFLGLPGRVPNHFFVAMIAVAILALGGGSRRRLLLLLRLLAVLTYFFAFFHKLNPNYFDNAQSPVWVIDTVLTNVGLHEQLYRDPILFGLGLVSSLALELCLPVLLWLRPTRMIGVVLGLVFHGVIALADAPDYTAVILAFYVVFLDEDEADEIAARLTRRPLFKLAIVAPLAAILVRFSYVFSYEKLDAADAVASKWIQALGLFAVTAGVLYALSAAAPMLTRWRSAPLPAAAAPLGRRDFAAAALLIVLYSLNCLGPYLGYKYFYSQAMFSALNTDGSEHFVMPRIGPDARRHFYRLREVSFNRAAASRLGPRTAPLFELFELRGHWVARNHLHSVLTHACRAGLGPIAIRMRGTEGTIRLEDACASDLRHHALNLYPHSPSSRRLPVK